MRSINLTCPVCKIAHTKEIEGFYSNPRSLFASDGTNGFAESCGNHTATELQSAYANRFVTA